MSGVTNVRRDECGRCKQDKRFQPEMDLKTGYVTRSIICLPILNHLGHVVGVAQLVNNKGPSGKFTDKDEQVPFLLSSLSIYISN